MTADGEGDAAGSPPGSSIAQGEEMLIWSPWGGGLWQKCGKVRPVFGAVFCVSAVYVECHSFFRSLVVSVCPMCVSATALCLSVPCVYPSVWPEVYVVPLSSQLSPRDSVAASGASVLSLCF